MESFEIRLSNLSFQATEDDIKDFVGTFAKVKEVKLILDYKKRSKGTFLSFRTGLYQTRGREIVGRGLTGGGTDSSGPQNQNCEGQTFVRETPETLKGRKTIGLAIRKKAQGTQNSEGPQG